MHILFHCNLYNDLRKTLFIKINDRNTLFTNYNIHDKVCFLFNNTDSHVSKLTANFVFQAFDRRKKKFIRIIAVPRFIEGRLLFEEIPIWNFLSSHLQLRIFSGFFSPHISFHLLFKYGICCLTDFSHELCET